MLSSLNRIIPLVLVVLCAAVATPRQLVAQVPQTVAVSDTIWEVRLSDGSTIVGSVTAVTADRVTVTTVGGSRIELQRSQIRSMTSASGTVRDGQLWRPDPNRTRLFFGPTGRMLNAGEGYVGVFELFLPFVSFGVSDFATLAGGTPIVPEGIGRIWYFAPKVGGRLAERTAVSAGVLALVETSRETFEDLETLGVAYAVATQGSEDRSVTLGVGFGFAGEDVSSQPVFLVGGEWRVSPRVKLLSENYLVSYRNFDIDQQYTDIATMISGGVRFIGERLSADAGIGAYFDDDNAGCCLPLVNFVYNF